MLSLRSITLTQFKNYRSAEFNFSDRITAICGRNGVGKTNLLDAIYYCCFTKSYFSRIDSQNVHHETNGFRIQGNFELDDGETVSVICILRETGRKEFLWQHELYTKIGSHIGKLPCVIIAPDDVQIIIGGSEERRRFLDVLLSQLDQEYLQKLIDYNKVLQQRNSLLRNAENPDMSLLDVYDEQLITAGAYVYGKRQEFLGILIPSIQSLYSEIAGTQEKLTLQYDSQLHDLSFAELLARYREKDRILQRSNAGIHKDDIDFYLDGQPFKTIASQGQRKSLLFALKLAEFGTLKTTKGFAPLLLLDDVFEKLDEDRMRNLLDRVCVQNNGQVFITDTHEERIRQHLEELDLPYQLISL
jgi:DNA replication and repair protein RecF